MNLDKMTIGEAKQLANLFGGTPQQKPLPFKVGEKYMIRGVTNYMLGEVREIVGDFLVLDNASWVADTGKFSEALEKGTLSEVERVPNGTIINTGSICDAQPWLLDLPTETK